RKQLVDSLPGGGRLGGRRPRRHPGPRAAPAPGRGPAARPAAGPVPAQPDRVVPDYRPPHPSDPAGEPLRPRAAVVVILRLAVPRPPRRLASVSPAPVLVAGTALGATGRLRRPLSARGLSPPGRCLGPVAVLPEHSSHPRGDAHRLTPGRAGRPPGPL